MLNETRNPSVSLYCDEFFILSVNNFSTRIPVPNISIGQWFPVTDFVKTAKFFDFAHTFPPITSRVPTEQPVREIVSYRVKKKKNFVYTCSYLKRSKCDLSHSHGQYSDQFKIIKKKYLTKLRSESFSVRDDSSMRTIYTVNILALLSHPPPIFLTIFFFLRFFTFIRS